MRIVLAYRKVNFSSNEHYLNALKNQLLFCQEYYPLSHPQTPPSPSHNPLRTEISITFDHASADFFYAVYPFLKEHKIPATVGVAWRYIPSDDIAKKRSLKERTLVPDALAFQDEIYPSLAPFCSPQELKELSKDPLIHLASHGIGVRNLINRPPYLANEVVMSKKYLSQMLGIPITTFIFPFGKYDKLCEAVIREHYKHSFILGNTVNSKKRKHLIYRLNMLTVQDMELFLSLRSKKFYWNNWVKESINYCVKTFRYKTKRELI